MRIAAVVLALVISGASWGQFFDGNELLVMCSSQDRSFDQGGCVGFIAGVSDTLKAAENRRGITERICVPGQVTTLELKEDVIKYLKLVPQFHDYMATFLVEMALRSAYPCSRPEIAGSAKGSDTARTIGG
jgi:hypothetical protein